MIGHARTLPFSRLEVKLKRRFTRSDLYPQPHQGERNRCTDQVGLLKAKHQLPALDEAREQQQHLRLTTLAQSVDIDPVFVRSLMTFVMGEVVKRHKHVASTHQSQGGPAAPTNEEPA